MPQPSIRSTSFALALIVSSAASASTHGQVLQRPDLAARIDEYMAPYVEGHNFAGSIVMAVHGRVIARRAYGLADPWAGVANTPDTRYHVASLSKPITATAVMLLADDGRLHIDDPIARYLPDFPGGRRITVHHLLTHTSGIPDINRFPEYRRLAAQPQTPETLVRVIAQHADGSGPTERYRYSNSNYNLLAYIVEQASGMRFGNFLTQRIFEPLGMAATAHSGSTRDRAMAPAAVGQIPVSVDEVGRAPAIDWSVKTGNGSIVSTGEDLIAFLGSLFDHPLLSDNARARMLTAHVDGVGYGWFLRPHGKRRVMYYNGSSPGVSAYFALYPDEGLEVVVLANHDIPLATPIGRDLASMVFGDRYRIPDPITPVPFSAREKGADYVGRYDFTPGWGFDITVDGDALIGRIAWPAYAVTLIPVGADRFFHRYYWDTLVFDRNEDGEVESLHWASSSNSHAKRVRGR